MNVQNVATAVTTCSINGGKGQFHMPWLRIENRDVGKAVFHTGDIPGAKREAAGRGERDKEI